MSNNNNPKQWDIALASLAILSALYFIVEIIINVSVYKQLAVSSSVVGIDVLEHWGKIITGFGAALLLTRLAHSGGDGEIGFFGIIKIFLFISVFTIPISFKVQDMLIERVVAGSSESDRNRAVIINATHNTLVPFYETSHKKLPVTLTGMEKMEYPWSTERKFMPGLYHVEKKDLTIISEACVAASEEKLGIHKPIDKAFFSYTAYKKGIDEKLYKSVIKDYHLCLYENERYFDSRTEQRFNPNMINEVYDGKYDDASFEYGMYAKKSGYAKNRADKEWREGMDSFLGFKSTLPPSLSREKFRNHKDVRRYYSERIGIKDLMPGDKDFEKKIKKRLKTALPAMVIPTYMSADGSYGIKDMKNNDIKIQNDGERAYKAVIMPLVALGLSGFFLVFNFIIVVYQFVKRFATKPVATTFLFAAIAIFLFYPLVQTDDPLDALDDSNYEKIADDDVSHYIERFGSEVEVKPNRAYSPAAKWVWWHERNLSKLYEIDYGVKKPQFLLDKENEDNEDYERYLKRKARQEGHIRLIDNIRGR